MSIPSIGSVLTPANFQVVSAQAEVLLTWSATPLTNIFYISRSTDNVTFIELGTTTGLSYNDSTAVVGTIYYYYVQAGNGTASSPATISLAGQALNPGQTTVGNLRLQIQQRANFENNPFITNQEWNSYISESYKELYDIIVQKFGDDYYVQTPYTYTTEQGVQLYPLPSDYYKLLGVEIALNPYDPNSWITLRQFEFVQRNLFNYPNLFTFYGITNLRYRLNGNNLYIVPNPQSGQTIRIWYVPRPSQLINDTDTVDAISGWEEYIIADCAIKALTKEETDTSVFLAQKQALLKRIEEAAGNRNIGDPQRVSDSRLRNFAWGDPGDFDNGGSWGY